MPASEIPQLPSLAMCAVQWKSSVTWWRSNISRRCVPSLSGDVLTGMSFPWAEASLHGIHQTRDSLRSLHHLSGMYLSIYLSVISVFLLVALYSLSYKKKIYIYAGELVCTTFNIKRVRYHLLGAIFALQKRVFEDFGGVKFWSQSGVLGFSFFSIRHLWGALVLFSDIPKPSF